MVMWHNPGGAPHEDGHWTHPEGKAGWTDREDPDSTPTAPFSPAGGSPGWPPAGPDPYDRQPRHRPGWLPAAAVLAAGILAAGAALALAQHDSGAPARQPAPAARTSRVPAVAPPALSRAAAEQVLLRYTALNNQANLARSDSALARAEAGSSYALDAGDYRWTAVTDPGNRDYAPLTLEHPAYYIPRLRAGTWPRWFAVQVTWFADGPHPASTGPGYILFVQDRRAAAWKDVLEPYGAAGSGPAPAITLDAGGYATALSSAAAGLAVRPDQVPAQTEAVLDGTGSGVTMHGSLADVSDKSFWTARLPAGSAVSLTHQPAGPAYALAAVGGGALLLYAGTGRLTLAPPAGETFSLEIPGYYSSAQTETSATVTYAEQYAAYDPPAGHGRPRVIAVACGIDGRG